MTLERQLYEALELAAAHLDYCGYGDAWERECASAAKLDEKIAAALARGEKELKVKRSSR